MTNEDLDMYEELSKTVDLAQDKLTGEILLLASMGIRRNEPVDEYVLRVENEIASIKACKRELKQVQDFRKSFLLTV